MAIHNYSEGKKYHVASDGKIKPCTARERVCKYSHFDTKEEASDNRQRVASTVTTDDIIHFESVIDADSGVSNLRAASDEARETFITKGVRPSSPLGVITVNLPSNQRITLKRETHDRPGSASSVGTRYRIRYFQTPHLYEQSLVELNRKLDYELFTKQMEEYFSKASDYSRLVVDDGQDGFLESYDNTMQAVSEVEVIARGGDDAYRKLGIDLFDHSEVGRLTLDSRYSQSAVQSYDVVDCLKGHSLYDRYVQEVAIHIHDTIDQVPGASWHLNRLPEDRGWYVASNSPSGVVGQVVKTPEECEKGLRAILNGHGVPEKKRIELGSYARQMMREVEASIDGYEAAVEARRARANSPEPPPEMSTEESKEGFASRLAGMFTR